MSRNEQRVTEYAPRQNGKLIDRDPLKTYRVVVRVKPSERDNWTDRNGGMRQLLHVAIWGTPAMNRASIWVHDDERTTAGHGTAGGHGYHRASAAVDAAIRSAGIELALPIDGYGDVAIEEALRAIARHLGYRRCLIVG